jgi:hypothetical protein
MRLVLVVNKDGWAIGTLARFLALGAPTGWQMTTANLWDADELRRRFDAWWLALILSTGCCITR